jgi:hypothetical protein
MLSVALFLVFCVSLNAKLAPLHEDHYRKPADLIPGRYIVVFKQDTAADVFEKQLAKATTMLGIFVPSLIQSVIAFCLTF